MCIFNVCSYDLYDFSLHALKDESYLRQTLQKQSAQLHQASISYAVSIHVYYIAHIIFDIY